MKFSVLLSAAFAAVASAEQIVFAAASAQYTVAGHLTALHSGAGWSVFAVSYDHGSPQVFDLEDGIATLLTGSPYPSSVGFFEEFLSMGEAVTPATLNFDGQMLTGSNFWACNNVNDPYNYSSNYRIIIANDISNTTQPYPECISVNVIKLPASEN